MNRFEYRVYDSVYEQMISGKKTIEFRLLNDKAKRINIGDEIRFVVLNNDSKDIIVEVINKYIYDNIEDLWISKEIINNALDYDKEAFINEFYNIFGKENVTNSKIVGLEFKIK